MFNGSTLLTTSGSVLAASFFMNVIFVVWIISAVTLVFVILIQKGKGGGLSSAFGGGMASNILGANTKKPLTWFTIALVGLFLFLAILLAKFYAPSISDMGPITSVPARQQPQGTPPVSPMGKTSAPAAAKANVDVNSSR
jgi:preprotein translocase subunit SecG